MGVPSDEHDRRAWAWECWWSRPSHQQKWPKTVVLFQKGERSLPKRGGGSPAGTGTQRGRLYQGGPPYPSSKPEYENGRSLRKRGHSDRKKKETPHLLHDRGCLGSRPSTKNVESVKVDTESSQTKLGLSRSWGAGERWSGRRESERSNNIKKRLNNAGLTRHDLEPR